MTWVDWLRLAALLAMGVGGWRSWKALPPPTVVGRRRYYRQPDGRFYTLFGRRARDPALLAALEAKASKTP